MEHSQYQTVYIHTGKVTFTLSTVIFISVFIRRLERNSIHAFASQKERHISKVLIAILTLRGITIILIYGHHRMG